MYKQYQTLIQQDNFKTFGFIGTILGFLFLATLLIYIAANKTQQRSLFKQTLLAIISSIGLSFGVFFLALAYQIYM